MKPEKVTDAESLIAAINDFSKKDSLSNNYLLPEDIHKFVEEEKLYSIIGDENLFLFTLKEGDILRMYYIVNNADEPIDIDSDLPIMTEVLFRANAGLSESELNFLHDSGFVDNIRRDQYTTKGIDQNTPASFAISPAIARQAVNLFNDSFDRYSGDFIPSERIDSLFSDNNLICVYDKDNELAGALHITIDGKTAWVSHVAVDPKQRRQGHADMLMKMFMSEACKRNAPRLMLWVNHINTAAISLYTKYGFKYTNKSTLSLIYQNGTAS